MVAVPRAVCWRLEHWVRRCHATYGTCRAPRARRAPPPAASPGECCKRVSCHGHVLDKCGSPGTTASPRRARVCMLASQDLSPAQQTCRVCASAALAPCSPPVAKVGFQVATNAARRECHPVAEARAGWPPLPRHATGAPRPRRSWRNGNCSPTRVASSTRCCRRLMRGCAPTRMSEATTSAAVPMVKELRKRETIRCKHFA